MTTYGKFAIPDKPNYTAGMTNEKAILKKLNVGGLSRKDAMAALGISQATLYRHKAALGITRPPGARKARSIAAQGTQEARRASATLVARGKITFEEGLAITKLHRTSLQRLINRIKASA